ncbi:hypothetical protein HORIV_45740 [Vreelandella olivaria]|uniref:DNA helicase DnaB-like N-terminal domain-containing protein n=1 Tax=Vreelandella olivaria TaxID=390919 RepID=A0ABM7GNB8_9GAMM|nr:hypothetical protein HORIV_45740 [Halomonas olivaria]
MLDNQAWDNVSERLVADDFYRYEHRLVFNVMIHLAEAGQPLDVVTLSEALEARGHLDTVGGLAFLAELARNTPSASNIRAYADIVRERATLRKRSVRPIKLPIVPLPPRGVLRMNCLTKPSG